MKSNFLHTQFAEEIAKTMQKPRFVGDSLPTRFRLLPILLLFLASFIGVGNAWGEVVSGTAYTTDPMTPSIPTDWTVNSDASDANYVKLLSSDNYIQTDEFCAKSFLSIVVNARKYGGPSDAQALITVSWWAEGSETVLGTVAPASTRLTDYTISSPTSIIANKEGYIKISCKGASSSKGSGVSQVTITYTSGSCSGSTTYTLNFNTGSSSDVIADQLSNVALPSATPCNDDWEFAGWATSSCSETTTAPTLYAAGSTYPATQDATLYAVYKKGSGKYERISSTPETIPGKYLIIYENSATVGYALKNEVYSNYYMAARDVAIDDHTIENPMSDIVWDVTYSSSIWYFKNESYYLYNWASGSYHELGRTTTKTGYNIAFNNGYAVFTDAGTSDPGAHFFHTTYNNVHEFKAEGSSGTTKNLYLYKLDVATYYSNPSCSSCSRPTETNESGVTSSGATLSWTAPASAPANGYLVAYSTSATAPSVSTISTGGDYTIYSIAAGTTEKTLTGLSDGTTYYWWVRSNCGGGDYSAWVEAESFTTKITVTRSVDGVTTTADYVSPYTLPTNISNACDEWTFLGWSTSTISKTTTAPSLVTKATASGTYYAVFQSVEGGANVTKTISIKDYAQNHSWTNATQYTTITDSPISLTASGGGNTGKYYFSDYTWRIYSSESGSVTITIPPETGNILSVVSVPSKTFNISGNTATFTAESQTKFKSFEITYGTGTTYYATTSGCCNEVANVDVTVAPRETSAVFSWTNQAAATNGYNITIPSASINVDLPAGTSTYTASGLSSNTNYTFTITAKGQTCERSTNGEFTTELGGISIAEWDTAAIYLDLGDAVTAVATVANQNTQAVINENVATELFFSKYFEAGGENKMIAVYNGTKETIDLTNYYIQNASYPSEQINLVNFGKTTGYIAPGEEIILARFDKDSEVTAKTCAQEEEGFENWISFTVGDVAPTGFHNTMSFGGRTSLGLYKNGNIIDVIGSHDDGTLLKIAKPCANAQISGYNDAPGFYTQSGDNITTSEEENDYFLSTNRCLLVRKNTVHDGDNAVTNNTYAYQSSSASDECSNDIVNSFATLSSEWTGLQIGNSSSNSSEINDLTCEGLAYLGSYDYNDYYAKYDTIITATDIVSNRQSDGTYKIDIAELDTMSCTNLRVTILKNGTETISGTWKVPIFVTDDGGTNNDGNVKTNDAVFTEEGDDCATCDVVVLKNANLEVVTGGKNQVRNIEVYAGATLNVPSGKEYLVNQLIMRSKDDVVSKALVKGTLTPTVKNVYLDKRIKTGRWYWISLPYRCRIADVTWRNGELANYGTDWLLKTYDGNNRANGIQTGNWIQYTGEYMEPGVGYILNFNSDILESGNQYAELRFPMAMDGASISVPASVNVPVIAYGANNSRTKDGEPVRPNHLGWNMIGNPYMNTYNKGNMPESLPTGELVKDPDTDDLLWKRNTDGVRYVVVPQNGGHSGYSQVAVGTQDLDPFMAYFVQVNGDSDNQALQIAFSSSNVKTSMIRRVPAEYEEDDTHPVWVGFTLSNAEGEKDETALLVSDNFTDDYDMMNDLIKWRGTYYKYAKYNTAPVLATRNNEGEMAFNALSDASAAAGVPVNYFAAAAGTYTFSMSNLYSLEEVEEAWLYDSEENRWTNLLLEDYSFYTAKGDNTTRFTLTAKVARRIVETPTDADNINAELSLRTIDHTLLLSGVPQGSSIYVYDMSGKMVAGERTAVANMRLTVPTDGVYNVRIVSPEGNQTLRAIVK